MIQRYALGTLAAGALAVAGLAGFAASADAAPSPGTAEYRVVQQGGQETSGSSPAVEGLGRGAAGDGSRADCPDKGGSGGSAEGSAPATPQSPTPAPSQSSGADL